MRIRIVFSFAAGLMMALWHQSAWAAPQILAVLATGEAIPFTCGRGVCEADLSTFCLQRDRPAPDFGTVYRPAGPGAVTLVLRGANGGERRIPAAEHVVFSENRGYTSASAKMPESVLAKLGAVSAAIEVGTNASLAPLARSGDPDPLTAEEIAMAVGPLRALGTKVVDESAHADAARVIATMINLLPPEDRVDTERRAALWRDVAGSTPSVVPDGSGLYRARTVYDGCLEAIAEPSVFSMRSCLEMQHDHLMRDLNGSYWKAFVGS